MPEIPISRITCCHKGCHVQFWITEDHEGRLRESHESFCCPNGHSQGFYSKNEKEKLQAKLDAEVERRRSAERRAANYHSDYEAQKKFTAAQKGLVTKLRKKIGG